MANGPVLTFYSYKGGTGRSMALANIAWILAANGKRVLAVDWDLEAPGLHKYFGPFLSDPELRRSPGLIDLLVDYSSAAATRAVEALEKPIDAELTEPWFESLADLQQAAVPVIWDFDGPGRIDLVPAGMQGPSYASRVNLFEWQVFYEKLQGGAFLDRAFSRMRSKYDYILIDSRTGVSDTAGICTVQLPDVLVVFFTLNHQSIGGASAIAASVASQRPPSRPIQIFPVPTRVDRSEKAKLDFAQVRAQATFYPFVAHIPWTQRETYWASVQIEHEAFYSYEEVLASFVEHRLGLFGSMLGSLHRLAQYITGLDLIPNSGVPEPERQKVLARFGRQSESEVASVLENLGLEYEEIRQVLKFCRERTLAMNRLVERVSMFADSVPIASTPARLFDQGRPGSRLIALALAGARPHDNHVELAVDAISNPRSQFEQFHALRLARLLLRQLDGAPERQSLQLAVKAQLHKSIDESDPSRWIPAMEILEAPGFARGPYDSFVRGPYDGAPEGF